MQPIEQPTQEQLTKRQANLVRKRLQREREKQKREHSIEAQQIASERAVRARRNLHFFGESSPGGNAKTFAEELSIHREFLRALEQQDAQPGESLRMVAKRTYESWLAGPFSCRADLSRYVSAFNRTKQQFDPDFGFEINDLPFEEIWAPPRDCGGDEPIKIEELPDLPKLPKVKPPREEPKAEQVAFPSPAPPVWIPHEQLNAITFTWVPPDARRYLNGSK